MISVVTTVRDPTPSVRALARLSDVIVVGDRKGPKGYDVEHTTFLPLDYQPSELSTSLPENNYARKNLGYIEAMQHHTDCIYETDDDNTPARSWAPRSRTVTAREVLRRGGWVNAYSAFTDEVIWPRGFPLRRVMEEQPATGELVEVDAPIQQGLADGSPDVDAVWRLTQDRRFAFAQDLSIWVPPGTWSPFNSQSTWWWPEAYPLMYLPSHCSFRMTDIWRSFVAQRCLWRQGHGLVYHAPEVTQDRNPHDLLRDFEDEVPGYLGNERFTKVIGSVAHATDAFADNMLTCYGALVGAGFFPLEEITLLKLWLEEIS